jgi:hypothetical protein
LIVVCCSLLSLLFVVCCLLFAFLFIVAVLFIPCGAFCCFVAYLLSVHSLIDCTHSTVVGIARLL